MGYLSPFVFASDLDPWTRCQDVPYDAPNPWDFIEIRIVDSSTGDVNWKWGRLEPNASADWNDFVYKFKVIQENGSWKIAYLEGFDFHEGIRSVN
ncbi:hypothetical protein [Sphingobacterium sp. LRF_L2]|uniref:hypothetical protein n=1 Tax=Sphingobacterium sp. LRF_L2 TaxID=3369421 RepID=UPI003F630E9E